MRRVCAANLARICTSAVCGVAGRTLVVSAAVDRRRAESGQYAPGLARSWIGGVEVRRRAVRDGAARDEPRVRHCGGDRGAPAAARQRARVRELLHRVRDAEGDDQSQPVPREPTIAQPGRTPGLQFFQ